MMVILSPQTQTLQWCLYHHPRHKIYHNDIDITIPDTITIMTLTSSSQTQTPSANSNDNCAHCDYVSTCTIFKHSVRKHSKKVLCDSNQSFPEIPETGPLRRVLGSNKFGPKLSLIIARIFQGCIVCICARASRPAGGFLQRYHRTLWPLQEIRGTSYFVLITEFDSCWD